MRGTEESLDRANRMSARIVHANTSNRREGGL